MKKLKKRILLGLFLLTYSGLSFGQTPLIQWEKSYGSSSVDIGDAIDKTSDGGYIISGCVGSNATVIKYDSYGQLQWQREYGTQDPTHIISIKQTTDGGYIMARNTFTGSDPIFGIAFFDIDIIKTNSSGVIQWQTSINGPENQEAKSIVQTSDGYVVVGIFRSLTTGTGFEDLLAIKLNNSGGIVWEKELGGSHHERAFGVATADNGGVVVVGVSSSNDGDVNSHLGSSGDTDAWVLKLNALGGIIWEKSYRTSSSYNLFPANTFRSVSKTNDGGYVLCGEAERGDFWVLKLDANGSSQWETSSIDGAGSSIYQTYDGGYLAVGTESSNVIIVKLNASGVVEWEKEIGGTGTDLGKGIVPMGDGGFTVLGTSESADRSNPLGGFDIWLVKMRFFTKLIDTQCDQNVNLSGNFVFDEVPGAEDYQLIIKNYYGSYYWRVLTSGNSNNFIPKSSFTGLVPNKEYVTIVRAKLNGSWGSFGPHRCRIIIDENANVRVGRRSNYSEKMSMKIYPNPSDGNGFTINLTGFDNEHNEVTINIYDVFGKLIYAKNMTSDSLDPMMTKVNQDGILSSGVYLVNVVVNGKLFNEKITVR